MKIIKKVMEDFAKFKLRSGSYISDVTKRKYFALCRGVSAETWSSWLLHENEYLNRNSFILLYSSASIQDCFPGCEQIDTGSDFDMYIASGIYVVEVHSQAAFEELFSRVQTKYVSDDSAYGECDISLEVDLNALQLIGVVPALEWAQGKNNTLNALSVIATVMAVKSKEIIQGNHDVEVT